MKKGLIFGSILLGVVAIGASNTQNVLSSPSASGVSKCNFTMENDNCDEESVIVVKNYIMDEPVYKYNYDIVTGKTIMMQGRTIIYQSIDFKTGKVISSLESWYAPTTLERESIIAYKDGEKNPNKLHENLIEYLDTLCGASNDSHTTPVSYDSFNQYLDYLENEGKIYPEEKEAYQFKYRKANDCLSEEDKIRLEKEKEEALKEQERLDKEWQDINDSFAQPETQKSELEKRIDSEVVIIKRTLEDFQDFDEELFISLRLSGVSYEKAAEATIKYNFEKLPSGLENIMNDNKGNFNEMVEGLSSKSFQESISNVLAGFKDFIKELFGAK